MNDFSRIERKCNFCIVHYLAMICLEDRVDVCRFGPCFHQYSFKLFKKRKKMLIKLAELINPLDIRIIACIEGDRTLVSLGSEFVNFIANHLLNFSVIYEYNRILSFEIPFEIAVLTVKDAVETCFEKKCLSWITIIRRDGEKGNFFLFGNNKCWSKGLISDIFVKNIFIVVNFQNLITCELLDNLLCNGIVFYFFF